jgi:RNA polymerase sigma factor (sigma-70 family)
MSREPFTGQRAIQSVSTDSDIIRRSRDSPAAFGELYDRHASVIYRYAARRAGDFVADDVTSETFLVAFERLDTFDYGRDDARPWLFGIATNLLRRHHRAEARTLKTLARSAPREGVDDSSDRIAAQVDATVATARIASTLKSMAAIDGETLLLHAWADLRRSSGTLPRRRRPRCRDHCPVQRGPGPKRCAHRGVPSPAENKQ